MHQEAFFCSPIAGLYTLADLARAVDRPIESVIALVEKHRIDPLRRHGVVRLYDERALRTLRSLVATPP